MGVHQKHLLHRASLIAAAALLAAVGVTPAWAQDTDQKLTAAQLQALVAKPADGRASNNFWKGAGYIVQQSLRQKTGETEIHAVTADIFIVQEGNAQVLLGGSVEGNRETGPNERRGGVISGGHTQTLSPGDVLFIPAGEPHQVSPVGGPFRYLVVKIDTKSAAR